MAELHDHYARVSKVKAEVLLQEWIPGGADRIGVWGGHVSASDSATYFTARKIVQSPEDFGTGCVVESDNIAELVDPSLRLCASLDYEGIAEIEYKHDPRDGEFKLIEINPRHWDWHQLGVVGESNITLAAYRHLTGQPRALAAKTELRRKWIAEDTFLTYTLQTFFEGNLSPGKVWRTVAGRRIYAMFCWSDPLPFLRYFGITLIPILCKRAARKVWQLVLTSGLTLSGHSKPFGDDALKPAPIPGDEVSFN
jgi:predicted ATP-grasp superfamily ATP-dependent carboligase